jgi:phospholipid transport system substrate-binding protein
MKSFLYALTLVVALAAARLSAVEADPAAPIRLLNDRLIEVMKQGGALSFEARESRLRPVVTQVYDMAAMTRGTLGLAANKLTSDEITQLADAYGRYSVATYADSFNKWGGERFEVEPAQPSGTDMMMVPSWIIGGDGGRTGIDYLMHQDNGAWRIVDVLFGGTVSQVAVRRSEFVPIFRRTGVTGLIEALDKKSQTLEKRGG